MWVVGTSSWIPTSPSVLLGLVVGRIGSVGSTDVAAEDEGSETVETLPGVSFVAASWALVKYSETVVSDIVDANDFVVLVSLT